MKKKIVLLLIVAVAILSLFTLTSCEGKGDLWIRSASIDAVVNENGDLTVHEKWTVKTDSEEGYRNLYRTVNTYDTKFRKASELVFGGAVNDNTGKSYPVEERVTSMSSDREYEYNVTHYKNTSYVVESGNNSYEIGVIIPTISSGDTITFTYTYVLKDFAGKYADVAEFDWKPYSSTFSMYIEKLDMKITMPSGVDYADEENTFAWLHCTARSNLSLDKNVITVTAQKIDAGSDVGVHSLVPTGAFGDLSKTSSEMKRTALVEQEDKWQEEYWKEQKKLATIAVVDIVVSIVLIVLAAAFAVLSHIFGKYRVKKDEKRYLREIPSDWTAAEMGEFFYYYAGGFKKHSGAILSATMLDLARRDYIDILPDEKDKYLIELKAVPQAMKDDLKDYETELMVLLSAVQRKNGDKPFSMKFFEKFAKENITFVNRHMQNFATCAKKRFNSGRYVIAKKTAQSILSVLGVLTIAVGTFLFVFFGKYFFYMLFGGWISGLILLFGTYKIPPLNKEGNKIHADTLALRDYMLDFSNLKEYEVPQLALWEEYLVYATMMGISEKVVKKLKLVYRELQEPKSYDPSYYHRGFLYSYIYLASRPGPIGGSAGVFDLGQSMQTAVRNANTFIRAQEISKNSRGGFGGFGGGGHGGGGFSGGGGFGGGGGGGRH